MKVHILDTPEEMSQRGKDFILKQLIKDKTLALGGATGSTPKKLYRLLAESGFDFSDREIWFLDEYFGKLLYFSYAIDHLHNGFLEGRRFKLQNIHVPNGAYYWNNQVVHSATLHKILEENPDEFEKRGPEILIKQESKHPVLQEIAKDVRGYEAALPKHRIQILGIGVEGHIGFNEVGTEEDSVTHLTRLADSTLEANKDDFADGVRTRYALTQGIRSVMGATFVILFAYGKHKAEAVHGFLLKNNPASVLRRHQNIYVYLTRDTLAEFNSSEFANLKEFLI